MKNHKAPAESRITKTEVVCPNDTNSVGMLQGGRRVEWMDIAAAVCAQTHAEKICVTASINEVDFNKSAMPGDIITIKAMITSAFNTSMEVFAQAFARHVLAGNKNLISEAYFTFVALDVEGKALRIPAIKPAGKNEKEQYTGASHRRVQRIHRKKISC